MTTSNPHRHTKKRLIKTVGAHTPCSCGYMQDGELYFYIKDYQGNVRVVLNQANQPVEVNSYYPYGGLMAVTTTEGSQPYKYGTKELDRENGLDLYDSRARMYPRYWSHSHPGPHGRNLQPLEKDVACIYFYLLTI